MSRKRVYCIYRKHRLGGWTRASCHSTKKAAVCRARRLLNKGVAVKVASGVK